MRTAVDVSEWSALPIHTIHAIRHKNPFTVFAFLRVLCVLRGEREFALAWA